MLPISLIANKITRNFNYTFVRGEDFSWSPLTATITHPVLKSLPDIWNLLHEIAHAELKHTTYTFDVELVRHEAHAWQHAKVLGRRFGVAIADDHLEDHLDSYRHWLHSRSTCPNCGQNGLQTKNIYSCINCRCLWRANEARLCGLRRTKLPNQDQIV